MTGRDVDRRDREALAEHAEVADVFTHTKPQAKLRPPAVQQGRGEIVVMTDVNDAPALKRGDVSMPCGSWQRVRSEGNKVLCLKRCPTFALAAALLARELDLRNVLGVRALPFDDVVPG